jgi:hypothetical protein
MREKRRSPRKIADEILIVFDQLTGSQIGRVVNISPEGLMLLSQEPIVTGSVYQLEMTLPGSDEDEQQVTFGAEAVWTSEATQPESYWTGFRIIDISNEGVLSLDNLIMNWHSTE